METAARAGEAELVRALRDREEAAFVELTRSYYPSMLRVAQMYVSSRAVAEEVIQETWIGVLRGIDRFEGRSSLKTWIFRILANTAKTRAEREGRTIPFSALDPARVPEPAVEPERFLAADHPAGPGTGLRAGELGGAAGGAADREGDAAASRAGDRFAAAGQRAVISLRDIEGWESGRCL